MKFTKEDLTILKNFATINQGIELKKGTVLKTIHPYKVILAEAKLSDSLPQNFIVHDLNKLLSVESLFEEPEFEFKTDILEIKDKNKKVSYRASERSTIISPPDKEFTLPEPEIEFQLNEDDYDSIVRISSILDLSTINITKENDRVIIKAVDITNPGSDSLVIDTGVNSDKQFNIVFKTDNLKLLPGGYDVQITPKAGLFVHKDKPVKYWVTVEKSSKFGTID